MNKIEFIEKILSRYSFYTEKDDKGSFYDIYSRVLTKKIDYTKLWDKFCNEYDSKTPPTGVELKKLAKTCYIEIENQNNKQWLQVEIYDPILKTNRNNDCFPKNTTVEQMIKFYENKFKCNGWKILKVY